MKQYDYLIVGAGLYGAVFAHEAKKAGKRCLVIDKRGHIAGNIYTEEVEGINAHRYGAHIFHTITRLYGSTSTSSRSSTATPTALWPTTTARSTTCPSI